jgi:hypothetical protein
MASAPRLKRSVRIGLISIGPCELWNALMVNRHHRPPGFSPDNRASTACGFAAKHRDGHGTGTLPAVSTGSSPIPRDQRRARQGRGQCVDAIAAGSLGKGWSPGRMSK